MEELYETLGKAKCVELTREETALEWQVNELLRLHYSG